MVLSPDSPALNYLISLEVNKISHDRTDSKTTTENNGNLNPKVLYLIF